MSVTNRRNNKLKVIHIVSGDLWAGAEVMAFNLLRRLRNYGDLDLSVLIMNQGKLAENLRDLGLEVILFEECRLSFQELVRTIRSVVKTISPDIIHSHRYKENLLAFLSTLPNRNIKLVSTQHGLPEHGVNKRKLKSLFTSHLNVYLLSHHFSKTVAVSHDIEGFLIKHHGFKQESVKVIHNGIELPLLSPSLIKRDSFVVGSSGRLFPVKDYPLLVKTAQAITETHRNGFFFELAGDGPEFSHLDKMIKELNLGPNFNLLGHQENMDKFYRELDVYINTSHHEGIPMTILEALSYGIPVVAPAVGGIVEIINDGKDGFLVKNRNPDELAKKCIFLKENNAEYLRMSRAAREKAEQEFSATAMAHKYYLLYQTLWA